MLHVLWFAFNISINKVYDAFKLRHHILSANHFSIKFFFSQEFEEEIASSQHEVNEHHIVGFFASVREKLFVEAIFTSMYIIRGMHFSMN